jgi:hypothetical protein
MTETKQDDKKAEKDSRGDKIVMSANIPEEQKGAEKVEIDQTAKQNDLGEGVHKNSKTFGTVISDYCPDAAGLTPEENAAKADKRAATIKSSEHGEQDDKSGGKSGKKKDK